MPEGFNALAAVFSAVHLGDLDEVQQAVEDDPSCVHALDDHGASPLHYATLRGHREIAEFLIEAGADVNLRDGEFSATPAGWAIEFLRRRGGLLAMEIDDLVEAIDQEDLKFIERSLIRFPALRDAVSISGEPLRTLAMSCRSERIHRLFE
ncbi:ankyrin repeat domain-containing protein [Thalassoglobus sp. JC818]|uniref:ankyrin repeat domain-containing protein n=1 Tax=Thalassoglobus sp. JC818 TaxID=3232136 RepID=UPI003457984D